MSSGDHWGIGESGERVPHQGEYEHCTEDNCLAGKATSAEGRVRLAMRLLEVQGAESVGGDFLYDERFKTEEWPRKGYPVLREDISHVLNSLSMAREMRDANADRIDEERENVASVCKVVGEMGEYLTKKAEEIKRLEGMVDSLRKHGGEHWFVYKHQVCVSAAPDPQVWVDICSVCDKPKGDPSHFGNGARALSSKEVEEAVDAVVDRLVGFLSAGLRMRLKTSRETARELLQGLPGVDPL